MISANFYPTQTTAFTVEYTDTIPNLTYDDPETMAAPYYMGYLNWDDVPSMTHMSKFNVVTGVEEAYVEFVDVTKTENLPWFFTGFYTTSASIAYGTYILNDSDKYVLPTVGAGGNFCFFNNLEIQRVGSYGSYLLYVFYNVINPATTPPTYSMGGAYLQYTSTNISVEDFWKWVSGEITLHTSITIGAVQEDIEFTFEDFANGYCEKEHTNGTVQFYLVDYSAPYSARDVQPNNEWARWSNTDVGTLMHAEIDGDEKPYLTNTFGWHSGYSDERYIRLDNVQTLSHYAGGYANHIMGGFNGRIPYTFFAYGSTDRYFVFGNMIVWKYTSSQTRIARIFTSHEIAKIYGSLFTRISTNGVNPSYGYADTIAYPLFNDDNSPKWEYVTGLQEDIQDQLQEWQYTNIIANTFTEADIPEYEPEPGPGPGGDSDEGSIPLNTPGALGATNAFTTRYVLNTTQIRTIGQRLWSTIGNGNELTWQNFFLTLSGSDKIDYSLTLSEVISYFVSLKYFPFNLNSVSSTTGEAGIRIGTGKSLIDAGSTTKTLNDSIVQLNGGRCTIPDKWNNYLDLEPYATASLYIPYCGTTELPMSVIAGETIGITYLVDMTTGAITAAVMKYSGSGAYFPIAVMNGSCGFDILMTGTNGNSQMTNAITNLASKSTQWVGQTLQSGLTGLMGGVSGKDASGMGALSGMANTVMGIGQDMIQQNIQMPKLYATAPMTSGSSSSLSSLILPQTAYIQIRRHNPYRLSASSSYKDELGLIGYRSAYQGLISSANGMGFVKCQNPNLAGVADAGATEAEINMIKSLLSDGIFT